MQYVISTMWDFLNYTFTYGEISFSLFDVFKVGILLSICGIIIGKIYFFITMRR